MLSNLPLQKPKIIDLSNSQIVPPSFTFSRESSGSYLFQGASTKLADNNIPRFTYYDNKQNLLIEPNSENILINTNNINTFNSHGDMTYSQYEDGWFSFKNDAILPSSAVQFIMPVKLNVHTFSSIVKFFDNRWAALSFHIIHIPSGNTLLEYAIFVDLINGRLGQLRVYGIGDLQIPIEHFSANLEDLGDGIYKCSLHCDVSNFANADDYAVSGAIMYAFVDNGNSNRTPNGSVYYRNPQLEHKLFSSSFIPTDTITHTRANDSIGIDLGVNAAIFIKGSVESFNNDVELLSLQAGSVDLKFRMKDRLLSILDLTTNDKNYKIGVAALYNGDIIYGINGRIGKISNTKASNINLSIVVDSPQMFSSIATYRTFLSEDEFSSVLNYN